LRVTVCLSGGLSRIRHRTYHGRQSLNVCERQSPGIGRDAIARPERGLRYSGGPGGSAGMARRGSCGDLVDSCVSVKAVAFLLRRRCDMFTGVCGLCCMACGGLAYGVAVVRYLEPRSQIDRAGERGGAELRR
jgi:hypothetical protein